MATNGDENSKIYWTWQQDKAFEKGLAMYSVNCEDRWHKIAQMIPGSKQPEEVRQHHQQLLQSIASIHAAANAALPRFAIFDSSITGGANERDCVVMKDASEIGNGPVGDGKGKEVEAKRDGNEKERRNGRLWTEVEHKQFLLGMQRFGRGDWKTIAKEFVKTRTPAQVASHAQKYFKKLTKTTKVKRRSIFDITLPAVQPQQLLMAANGFGVGAGVGPNYLIPSQNQPSFVVANEVPNVANNMPNVLGQPWLMANEAPLLDNEAPNQIGRLRLVANEVPNQIGRLRLVVNEAPLVVNEVPNEIGRLRLVANEAPLVVNEVPNQIGRLRVVTNEVPLVVNEVPNVKARTSLVANEVPLVVNEVPNVVDEVPNMMDQPWLGANGAPLVVSEVPNAVNEEPNAMGESWSPLFSPPENWCLDLDFDIFDFDLEECLSQLPPL